MRYATNVYICISSLLGLGQVCDSVRERLRVRGEGYYDLRSLHVGGIMDPGAHEQLSPTSKSKEAQSFQLFSWGGTAGVLLLLHFKKFAMVFFYCMLPPFQFV